MPSTTTAPHTLRLKNELWKAIDQAASELEMSRNEWIRRRLASAFSRASQVPKRDDNVSNTNDETAEAAAGPGLSWIDVND